MPGDSLLAQPIKPKMKTPIQKATIRDAPTKFTTSHRKEGKCFFSSMSIISLADKPWHDGRHPTRIDARYYGTGNKNFCCIWINDGNTFHRHASGSAGGYGYHRPSTALSEAISNAGICLSRPIDGVGEEAMREALLAIAKALKIKRPALIESHA